MDEQRELTVELMNAALEPVSREHGYCLCIHPMMTLISMVGLTCAWCGQPGTDKSYSAEARTIRTEAVKAAYPWAVKLE
ncbi:MAG TPA: hypothetical protein VNV62_18565 [Trebonia sp.]|jgi:hypothetical protein|nr:hypothetical protein [Trebonia sp.]